MATATCKLAVLNPPQYTIGSNEIEYFYTLTFSAAADTYATGGITLDLTQATNLSSTSTLPISVWIYPLNAQPSSNQHAYQYVQGTTQANGKCQIFEGAAEKTNAQAMNAGGNEFADSIRVVATFARR
jgi:hypothetical protein